MQQTSFQLSELNGSSDLPASKLIKYTNIRLVQLSALDLVEYDLKTTALKGTLTTCISIEIMAIGKFEINEFIKKQ